MVTYLVFSPIVYLIECPDQISKEEVAAISEHLWCELEVLEMQGADVTSFSDLPVICDSRASVDLAGKSLASFVEAIAPFMGVAVTPIKPESAPYTPTILAVCETESHIWINKYTETAATFLATLTKQMYKTQLPTHTIDKWLDFYALHKFTSFEEAVTLVEKLVSMCKSLPTVKKLQEDISVLKTLGLTPLPPQKAINPTWTALRFNTAEQAVCEALPVHFATIWKLKTVQLIVLRWFLYERQSAETRSAQITAEFNTWLAAANIKETVAEVGTLLRTLGYTSRRVASGIRWDLSDREKLIGTAMLRETDLFPGAAQLFALI